MGSVATVFDIFVFPTGSNIEFLYRSCLKHIFDSGQVAQATEPGIDRETEFL